MDSTSIDGRARVVIAAVAPEVDDGKFACKRVLGDELLIEATLIVDGHTRIAGVALARARAQDQVDLEVPLVARADGSDVFVARVPLDALGRWQFTVEAWVDAFATWRWGFARKVAAGNDVTVELADGVLLIERAIERLPNDALRTLVTQLRNTTTPVATRAALALHEDVAALMARAPDRTHATRYPQRLEVFVEPVRAQFSAWYEMFPRSTGPAGMHGTFVDAARRLPYIASLGFDVVYLPPIHPIGTTNRKGPNNSLQANDTDPGSPWAIGNVDGGHKSIHPRLGTAADFRRFVSDARLLGIDVALDIALQCAPDHPYVKEHPDWFIHRADQSIQFAENPPKQYQDVYPLDFECADWRALWNELKSIFDHWIAEGVRVFRVDNPHTKPLPFWAWCIDEIKQEHPDVIFLAEAFTRPQLMYALAKIGFSQSYTYFSWRNTKQELTDYLTLLTKSPVSEFLRPNFWPTTPDILPEALQIGGRPAFIARAILAGTLSSSFGIFGPSYELCEHVARPGAEELLDSEKYQLRDWNLDHPNSIRDVLTRLNRIRREHKALHDNRSLRFHATDNEFVIAYSKGDILVVVNLDPHHLQAAWIDLDWAGILPSTNETSFQVHDLLSDARYVWRSARNYVQLDPAIMPAHIFVIRHLVRREREFEYYL